MKTHIPVGRTNVYTSKPNTRQDLKILRENTKFMREIPEQELNSGWNIRKKREEEQGWDRTAGRERKGREGNLS